MRDFDHFWSLYPRRIAKKAAQKAYARVTKTVSPAAILMALDDYIRIEWRKRLVKYIPHPATWINATDFSPWEERTELLFDEDPEMTAKIERERQQFLAETERLRTLTR